MRSTLVNKLDDSEIRLATTLCIGFQTLLLTWVSWASAPNCDELGHLASGLYHWNTGRFDSYTVNPPLVRMWATLPLLTRPSPINWSDVGSHWKRLEWVLANTYMENLLTEDIRQNVFVARLWCLPFCILGGLSCFAWSRDHFGNRAAIASLIFWSFSPNVIAWGASVASDLPAASLGVFFFRLFSLWRGRLDLPHTILLGLLQGLLILSKSTWIILFGLTPFLFMLGTFLAWKKNCLRILVLLTMSLATINLGYGNEGFIHRCDKLDFQSNLFRQMQNRLEHLPIEPHWLRSPFPESFIKGLDLQRHEFEKKKRSYLWGQWKIGGWWHYYLLAAIWKIPLAFWCLIVFSFNAISHESKSQLDRQRIYHVLPAFSVFLLASSQDGFSRHLRYVAPCLPFLIVQASQAASSTSRLPLSLQQVLVCWYVLSSVSIAPYFHSYFNELAGGPTMGHRYLLDSNLDWGEDLYAIRSWALQHTQARPLYYALMNDQFAGTFKIDWQPAKRKTPGWYLISIHRLQDPISEVSWLQQVTPVGRIGYSTRVFFWQGCVENETAQNCTYPVAVASDSH